MNGSPRDLIRDLWLASSTGSRMLVDDPAHAIVQAARRLRVGRGLPPRGPAAWQALMAHLADHPDEAATLLAEWSAARNGRTALDRLAVSVAVARGLPDLIPDGLLAARDQARLRLQAGDFSGALAALPADSPLARRIASDRKAMTAGVQLDPGSRQPISPIANRVLHMLTNSLPHTQSGYTRRSHAIMGALTAAGWDVQGVTRLGYPASIGRLGVPSLEVVDGVPTHRLLPWKQPDTLMGKLNEQADLVTNLVHEFRPQILHTTTDHTNAMVAREVAARTGLPWIYEMRGQLEYTWLASRPAWAADEAATSERLSLQRDRETELALAADEVVVLSEVQRKDLIDRGVPASKITLVPNAVDEGLLTKNVTPHEARSSLGMPVEGLWLGAASSVVEYEGFDVAIRATAILRERGIDARCIIVGDGTALPGLRQLAEDQKIAQWCHFPGREGRSRSITWVQALDVVVVPRRDTLVCRLVTPLKPVEAMALRRPVVASNLPALAELLADGRGTLVPPGDPEALADAVVTHGSIDSEARTQAQNHAWEWASSRTWTLSAEIYAQLYSRYGGRS